jgi:hypothetical protein
MTFTLPLLSLAEWPDDPPAGQCVPGGAFVSLGLGVDHVR